MLVSCWLLNNPFHGRRPRAKEPAAGDSPPSTPVNELGRLLMQPAVSVFEIPDCCPVRVTVSRFGYLQLFFVPSVDPEQKHEQNTYHSDVFRLGKTTRRGPYLKPPKV